jgi:hypothetical protein
MKHEGARINPKKGMSMCFMAKSGLWFIEATAEAARGFCRLVKASRG